jgi:hypothetical protein
MTCNFEIKVQIPPVPSKEPEIKVHIPLHTSKKPKNEVRIRLQLSKKPEIEVPTPPQPKIPRRNKNSASSYTFLTIKTWFLATWIFSPSPPYLQNLNIPRAHDAPLIVWKLHAEVCIGGSIKAAREEFIT